MPRRPRSTPAKAGCPAPERPRPRPISLPAIPEHGGILDVEAILEDAEQEIPLNGLKLQSFGTNGSLEYLSPQAKAPEALTDHDLLGSVWRVFFGVQSPPDSR